MIIQLIPQDSNPKKWSAFCSTCDKYVSEPSEDDNLAYKLGLVHQAKNHAEYAN